jgi:uncharacterized protein (TIGR02588 family)
MKRLEKNWLEWSVFAFSFTLVAGVLIYLTYDALTRDNRPPDIIVQFGEIKAQEDHYLLPVLVANHGDLTAKNIQIEILLNNDGQTLERATFEIDFLPRRATHEGWVTFRSDPQSAKEIQAHILGYQKP